MDSNSFRISRRKAIGFLGAASLTAVAVGCATDDKTARANAATGSAASSTTAPQCVLTAEQITGPFYIDDRLLRSDIREDRQGVVTKLAITVVDTTTCKPLPNVAVDIWHCDAMGEYSGYLAMDPNENFDFALADATGHATPSDQSFFLRGVQLTDSDGVATFTTIFPGWYAGRATHIHLKARVDGQVDGATYTGGHTSHTGQLYFQDHVVEDIALLQPYATHTGITRVKVADDAIGGSDSIMEITQATPGTYSGGITTGVTVGIDPSVTATEPTFGNPG